MCDLFQFLAHVWRSQKFENLKGHLPYLCDSAKNDIFLLIHDHAALFSGKPTQTTVLMHDIDVGDRRPIKQHVYHINPVKQALMQTEVAYLLENGFAVPSSSP